MKRELKLGDLLKRYVILLILLVLVIFFSILSPGFRTINNFFNISRQVSIMGIASVGMMFVLLIGGIDLSIGSQVAFVNVLCGYLIINAGIPVIPAVLLCVLVAVLAGFIMGTMVAVLRIPAFIATLAFMNILKGAALAISSGLPIYGFPKGFNQLGQG